MPDARALYKEGFAHFANDEIDEAIGRYREAIEADPELAIAWNGLSIALAKRGSELDFVGFGHRLMLQHFVIHNHLYYSVVGF